MPLYAHIIMIVVLTVLILLGVFWFTKIYTHHGQKIEVPDLRGYTIEELSQLSVDYGFVFIVKDSVYRPDMRGGEIISHSPKIGDIVKKKRKFYMVVASQHKPMVEMPNLIDLSYRRAVSLLKSRNLRLGKVREVSSVAHDAVLSQFYNGTEIEAGSLLPYNSAVDITVGYNELERKKYYIDSSKIDNYRDLQEEESAEAIVEEDLEL